MAAAKRIPWILLALVLATAFVIRYYSAVTKDRFLSFDELVYVKLAMQLKEKPFDYDPKPARRFMQIRVPEFQKLGYFAPAYMVQPLFKHPPLYPYFLAASFFYYIRPYPFANGFFVSILSGILTILAVFLLAKHFYGGRTAVLSALFLAIDPNHWLCSVRLWLEPMLVLWITLAVYFFSRLKEDRRFGLAAGLAAGLGLLTKYTAVLLFLIFMLEVVLYERELMFKKRFWAIFAVAGAMFSPWLWWNWRVYGEAFWSHILKMTNAEFFLSQNRELFTSLGLMLTAAFLLRRWPEPARPSLLRKWLLWSLKYSLPAAAIGCLVAAACHPAFWFNIRRMAEFGYLPKTGWEMGFFGNQPWFFYLGRCLELSPLYYFAFFSVCLFFLMPGRGDTLLALSAAVFIFFAIFWGNYQSRYLLPAVPFFLILAARLVVYLWDWLGSRRPAFFSGTCRLLLIGVVLAAIAKTLRVDAGLVYFSSNHMCYF